MLWPMFFNVRGNASIALRALVSLDVDLINLILTTISCALYHHLYPRRLEQETLIPF
jgi:hypothetical protein